jgi:hypothetical protein
MIPDPQKAGDIAERVMQNSLDLWKQIENNE